MDIKVIEKEKQQQNIEVNDLVVVHEHKDGRKVYGIVIHEKGDNYNILVLDDYTKDSWYDYVYTNELTPLSYDDLQRHYTLAKKADDYKITIEL